MIELHQFPALNATLNAFSGLCVALGYLAIRQDRRRLHAICMSVAVVVSAVFLGCYLYHKYHAGHTVFAAQGWIRPVYFAILLSHTILAAVVALWLVPVTLYRAARQRWEQHRSLARWTLPLWFYVSVTGVVIYFILYHWYAPA
ncbi:MAG: hypothetical protein PCFJNLEI_01228 [Verrucomicrobiae bacterium]|nr:hypothetical protein [Verrucomicrobiae bacterium]